MCTITTWCELLSMGSCVRGVCCLIPDILLHFPACNYSLYFQFCNCQLHHFPRPISPILHFPLTQSLSFIYSQSLYPTVIAVAILYDYSPDSIASLDDRKHIEHAWEWRRQSNGHGFLYRN